MKMLQETPSNVPDSVTCYLVDSCQAFLWGQLLDPFFKQQVEGCLSF
jgi:hypothetical protein